MMELQEALPLLSRTPDVLESLLAGLPEPWLTCREDEGTWNALEVMAHMIEAERANWIPRLNLILAGSHPTLPDFDREAYRATVTEREPHELLKVFKRERTTSLAYLREWDLDGAALRKTAMHPELGVISVSELIATWTVHDLAHISQMVRVMAVRYRADVGPWAAYLRIVQ